MHNYVFKTEPWAHQLAALNYLYPKNCAALYTDMGTGKTKIMIDLIRNKGFKCILVVCPIKACPVWIKQISVHAFKDEFSCMNLSEYSTDKKVQLLAKKLTERKLYNVKSPLVLIVNYDSAWRGAFGKLLLSKELKLDCVICDESHRIKSPSSKCSRFLTNIGKRVNNRYLMTGTPLAENPTDVYAQYRFLDPSIFGTNFGNFKARYENIDPIKTAKVGYTILKKEKPYINLDELKEKMFSCAFKCNSSLSLPKTKSAKIEFKLSKKAQEIYTQVKKEGALELKQGTLEINNVLTQIIRLQQITSGYVALETEEGEQVLEEIDLTRKEILIDLLEQLPSDEPVVVFAKYRADFTNIRKAAEELKRGYSEVSGKEDTLEAWQSGKTSVLGVQFKSGSEALDLTRSHYAIYYSLTHSLAQYKQSRKRLNRPGQTQPVTYYHIIGTMDKGETIDEQILQALRSKQNVIQYIMKNPPR